ncbi:cbb3-type cytochrome c oxidase subunit III [Alteromonadaceae bacterium 2753L.S.0a.02]|nr:cbb3-type cytochrome c oxidase subunit III [Alteromonadaceae bacterium 2753L.S.0a.02]
MKKYLYLFAMLLVCGCAEKGPPPEILAGEQVFIKTCKVCHAQGINGAPILGNSAMWAPRKDKGLDVLVQHASEGFGLMPAKGGNPDLTQTEISHAVQFMLSKLKEPK